MKRLLVLLLAAIGTMAQASDLTPEQKAHSDLMMAVQEATAVVNHRVTLEGYDFDIFIDNSVSPPAVVTQQTMESIRKMFDLKSEKKQSAAMRHARWLSVNYARSIRGESPLPAEEQKDAKAAEDPEPEMIHGCPENFPPEDYGENTVGGHKVTIDKLGRPAQARIKLKGPPIPAKNYPDCRAKVGDMGGRGSADHGGHHIGSRLGGWGKRANLTPQNAALNLSGEWKDIDKTIELCAINGYEPDQTMNVTYFKDYEPEDLRPIGYHDRLTVWFKVCPPKSSTHELRVANETPDQAAKVAMRNFTTGVLVICSRGVAVAPSCQ